MSFEISGKLRFNDKEYKPGCVWEHIEKLKKYKRYIGLDFGDGVCTVYLHHLCPVAQPSGEVKWTWLTEAIKLPNSIDDGIPTVIAYDDKGHVTGIGRDLEDCEVMFHQFKVSPSEWEKKVDSGHTYKSLIKDYLKTLWKLVLEKNDEIRENAETTFVVIGHPGGKPWSDAANLKMYSEMLKEVFKGYEVGIMPEPFAAIFGAIYEGSLLEISKGVYIIEPGSSTTDTCYILPGKRISTNSVNCAGRNIDISVYQYLLHNNKKSLNLEPSLFDQKSVRKAVLNIRGFKETYCRKPAIYDGNNKIQKSIILSQAIPGSDKFENKRIDFVLDNDLFENALKFERTENGPQGVVTHVWNDDIKNFLAYDKACICTQDDGNLACNKIILAGGTSNVPYFVNAVEDVFKNEKNLIHKSSSPTQTVAEGLAFRNFFCHSVTKNGFDACIKNTKLQAEFEKKSKDIARLIAEFMATILKYVCDEYMKSPNSQKYINDYGELMYFEVNTSENNKIYDAGSLTGTEIKNIIFNLFDSVQPDLRKNLTDYANNVIYKFSNCEKINFIDLADMDSNIDRLSDERGHAFVDALFDEHIYNRKYIKKFFSTYEKFAFSNTIIPQKEAISSLKKDLFDPSVYKKRVDSVTWEIHYDINAKIRNGYKECLYDLLREAVETQAEIYLGKALLLITED